MMMMTLIIMNRVLTINGFSSINGYSSTFQYVYNYHINSTIRLAVISKPIIFERIHCSNKSLKNIISERNLFGLD